jgi:hypothetical protein
MDVRKFFVIVASSSLTDHFPSISETTWNFLY